MTTFTRLIQTARHSGARKRQRAYLTVLQEQETVQVEILTQSAP